MAPTRHHPVIDALFDQWHVPLGAAFLPYRNHVYRVFHMAVRLGEIGGEDLEKTALAAAFHDIGIWLAGTFDYLPPSVTHLDAYLQQTGRVAWRTEIEAMILQHHKVTPWHGPAQRLVEPFRRADWLDVCLFALPTRLPRSWLAELRTAFPRLGFHALLIRLGIHWGLRHPLRPLPMMRW